MSDAQPRWKQFFWLNTVSNYLRTLVRLGTGVLLFRFLYEGLSPAQFGFWSLLWSLFGYGVLLDFGFGFTAQKAVAEKTTTGDWAGLSRLLATMFWTFAGLAVILALSFFIMQNAFLGQVEVPEADRADYISAYLVFFGGLALVFPLGLFPEILRGLHRLDIANWLHTASTILNFLGIWWALAHGWELSDIVLIAVATTLLPNLLAAFFAMKMLPQVSLMPKHFDWKSVRSQMGFSISAYLITFSNLIMAKSDQAVIGFTLGVGAVTIYQAGYKVGEMLNLFTQQLQAALSPAAASLQAENDQEGLRQLLLSSSRLTFLITTPLYALSATYLTPLIQLLTGLEAIPWETYWIGQVLLLAIYSSQMTNSCSKRIMMMTGHEGFLLRISLLDAGLNLALSVSLVLIFKNVLCVALGTLIPTVLVGWVFVLPMALHEARTDALGYARYLLTQTWWPLLVFGLGLGLVATLLPLPDGDLTGLRGLWELGWRAALAGGPSAVLILPRLKGMMR